MNRRYFIYLSSVAFAGCSLAPSQESAGVMERAAAELIRLSVNNGVNRLAQNTLGDVEQAIALPDELASIKQSLSRLGVADYLESIEKTMQKGVQLAVQEVKPFLLSSANQITPLDAATIITGGKTSATDYIKRSVGKDVEQHFANKLQAQLSQLDFYADYKKLKTAYSLMPMMNKPDLDLESQLVSAGVNLLFETVGQEEMKVRNNPAQAASAVLQAVL